MTSVSYYVRKNDKKSKSKEDGLKVRRGFFVNNRGRMRYSEYRGRGLPIRSGPVEAACKNVVKVRMSRSGIHRTRSRGQNIHNIRSLIKSGRWDVVWDFYAKRNPSRYYPFSYLHP